MKALLIKRAEEKEAKKQIGLKLQAEEELKRRIAAEIARRKKIATLRKWHDNEDRRMKCIKRLEEEKIRQKEEKVNTVIFNPFRTVS